MLQSTTRPGASSKRGHQAIGMALRGARGHRGAQAEGGGGFGPLTRDYPMNAHGMGMPFMMPLQEMKGGSEELSAKGAAAAGVEEFSADMISPGAHTGAITNRNGSRYGAGPRHERSIQLLKQQMDDGASRHARAVYAAAHSRARGLKRKPFDDYSKRS